MIDLAVVRQLEAVAFRAWPSASNHYDGSWLIRQTAGHPSKRLNSVNALDPSDHHDIEARIESAARRFKSYNRPLVFRQSPLASPQLDSFLDARGWIRFDDSIVLTANLEDMNLDDAVDLLPVKDVGWYVGSSVKVHDYEDSYKAGLTEVITSIEPKTGFFVVEEGDGDKEETEAVSTALCVLDDKFAGVLDLATHKKFQRQGHAVAILRSAFLWARYNGAKTAWIQVETTNSAARALYEGLGFSEVYRYSYRKQPEHTL